MFVTNARFALIMVLISTATSLTTFKKAVNDFIKEETEQKMNLMLNGFWNEALNKKKHTVYPQ